MSLERCHSSPLPIPAPLHPPEISAPLQNPWAQKSALDQGPLEDNRENIVHFSGFIPVALLTWREAKQTARSSSPLE